MNLNIEFPDELLQEIETYIQTQSEATDISAVIRSAVRSYLTEQKRSPTSTRKQLRITPAEQGSGYSNTSIDHDRILTNLE